MTYTDSSTIRDRLHKLTVRSAQLQGVRKADTDARNTLVTEVAEAKGRLSLGEEVGRIFNALQRRAHDRSVGAFERLLTAILQDVLPEEGAVRLLPEYKNNTTWLDVALEKQGELEDLLDGNGGAVTNVVSAGLRFAALSRTKNRRLMVLDEPDCWLKTERVPAFVRVIAQVSEQAKTQTFFITHHDTSYFEGQVNVVRFSANENGKVEAAARAPVLHQWQSDDEPGIRSIELINFRRHEHTVIPCFPGATAFIGDNNLGKSTAIVSSFKALGYGESDDSMIRHNCDEARIIMHLEAGRRIEWSRSKKRSPSVLYRFYDTGATEPTMEGRPKTRNQAPEWVTDILGIKRVDDLDIQVGNQKSPVFLLNDTASRRAQILSIGRESSYLKELMKQYGDLRSSDSDTVKHGEARLAKLEYRLKFLAATDVADARLVELFMESDDILNAIERREQLVSLLTKLDSVAAAVCTLEQEVVSLDKLPAMPELFDVAQLDKLIQRMDAATKVVSAPAIPASPDAPSLKDLSQLEKLVKIITNLEARTANVVFPELPETPALTDVKAITEIGVKISSLVKVVATLEGIPAELPTLPSVTDVSGLASIIEQLNKSMGQVTMADAELVNAQGEFNSADEAFQRLKDDLGGLCPLCGSTFEHEQEHGHAHIH